MHTSHFSPHTKEAVHPRVAQMLEDARELRAVLLNIMASAYVGQEIYGIPQHYPPGARPVFPEGDPFIGVCSALAGVVRRELVEFDDERHFVFRVYCLGCNGIALAWTPNEVKKVLKKLKST